MVFCSWLSTGLVFGMLTGISSGTVLSPNRTYLQASAVDTVSGLLNNTLKCPQIPALMGLRPATTILGVSEVADQSCVECFAAHIMCNGRALHGSFFPRSSAAAAGTPVGLSRALVSPTFSPAGTMTGTELSELQSEARKPTGLHVVVLGVSMSQNRQVL